MTQENLEKANKLDAERRYLKMQLRELEAMKPDTILFALDTKASVHPFELILAQTKVTARKSLMPVAKILKAYIDAANKRIREIDREIKKL